MNKSYNEALRLLAATPVADEQRVLDLLKESISEGFVDAYPLYALLSASNDWTTLVICRMTQFQILLREGVEKGCLAPEGHDTAWYWLGVAAQNNDPTPFLDDDMDEYYDLLMTAVEQGNDIAHDIMDIIWEPEQEQEED